VQRKKSSAIGAFSGGTPSAYLRKISDSARPFAPDEYFSDRLEGEITFLFWKPSQSKALKGKRERKPDETR